MSKSLFFFAAIFSMAQANAVQANVRLSYVQSPISLRPGAPVTTLTVNSQGAVVGQVCRAVAVNPCRTTQVTTLSPNEIDTIDSLIEEARSGQIVVKDTGIRCLAMGTDKKTLTADNGKVFLLEESVICPASEKVNTSPAAAELIQKLNDLYGDYNREVSAQR
jgi:hypothetical protein